MKKLLLLFLFIPVIGYGQNQQPANITNNIYTGNGSWERNNVGIDTFNPVGIGSTNPGTSLDVNGTVRMIGFQLNVPTTVGYVLTATDTSGDAVFQASTGGISSQWITTGGSVYYPNTGNVGIGSQYPGVQLDINGTVRASNYVGIQVSNVPTLNQNTSGTASNLSGTPTLPNGTAATTQSQADASTKLATTAYVDTGLAGKQATGAYLLTVTADSPLSGSGTSGSHLVFTNPGYITGNQSITFTETGDVSSTATGTTTLSPAATLATQWKGWWNGGGNVYSNDNVGIGSMSPGQSLDVNGTARASNFSGYFTGNLSGNAGTVTNGVYTTNIGSTVQAYNSYLTAINQALTTSSNPTFGTVTATLSGNASTATTAGTVTTAAQPSITSVGTLTNLSTSGNVGVGSASPGELLDVTGTVRDIGEVVNGNIGIGSAWPGSPLDVVGTFRGFGNEYIQGNIGVGSVSPGVALDVNGSVRAANFIGSGWLVKGSNVYQNVTGNVGIGSFTPGQILDVSGTVRASFGQFGNIGIGTYSPCTTQGNCPSSGSGTVTSSGSPVSGNIPKFTTATNIAPALATDIAALWSTCSGTQYLGYDGNCHTASGSSQWTTNGSNVYFPASGATGNVGIGTQTPGQSLDVDGTIRVVGASANSPAFVITTGNVGIDSAWPGTALDVIGTIRGGQAFLTGGGNTYMNAAGGNVGIGTTLSMNTLDINGGEAIGAGYAGYNTAPTNGLIVQGNVSIGTQTAGSQLVVGSTGQFTVNSSGAVSTSSSYTSSTSGTFQCTTTPCTFEGTSSTGGSSSLFEGGESTTSIAKLLSTSASGTTDQVQILMGNNGATNAMEFQDNSGQVNVGIGSVAPGGILDVEGTLRMVFNGLKNPNGNVGIGSFSPGQQLDVFGTIRAIQLIATGMSNGNIVCDANGVLGHCTGSSSCLTTCTCTCVAN